MRTRDGIALAAAAGSLFAVVSLGTSNGGLQHGPGIKGTTAAALEVSVPVATLARFSDLVVVGRVTGRSIRRFSEEAVAAEPRFRHAAYEHIRVEPRLVLKGAPKQTAISVRRRSGLHGAQRVAFLGEFPELRQGRRYLLFLRRGSGPWGGGFLALGRQGVGRMLDGGRARLGDGRIVNVHDIGV